MASKTNNVELLSELPPPSPPAPKSKIEYFKHLGEVRDSLLVLASVLYFLGYLSWAFYAWEHQLGLLPVLDAQYFAAGVFPALIILGFCIFVKLLAALSRWIKEQPSGQQETIGKLMGSAMTILMIAGFIVIKFANEKWGLPLFYIGAFFGYGGALILRNKGSKFLQAVGQFLVWFILILGSVWLILAYLERWFPNLPQEWGGPKPRCLRLDIDSAKISQETLEKILPGEALKDAKGVCRSKSLQMIFDGSEFVLLNDNFDPVNSTHRFYKIKKDSIAAVLACE